jgi:riboflavin transporter
MNEMRPFFLRGEISKEERFTMGKKNLKVRRFVTVAMLGSISFVIMLLNFPLPGFPTFLKIDFSDVPALIAVLTMGPVAGILVELLKNVLEWIYVGSPTGVPVGQMANFATGVLFILPVYYIYNKFTSVKGLIVSLIIATVTMSVGMAILNYVAFIPMYAHFMNYQLEAYETIVLGILPFNLIKGVMLFVVVLLLFKTMNKWIESQRAQFLA